MLTPCMIVAVAECIHTLNTMGRGAVSVSSVLAAGSDISQSERILWGSVASVFQPV